MKSEGLNYIKNLLDELKENFNAGRFIEIKKENLLLYDYKSFFDSFRYSLEHNLNDGEKTKIKEFISDIRFRSCGDSIHGFSTSFEEFYSMVKYDFDRIYKNICDLL